MVKDGLGHHGHKNNGNTSTFCSRIHYRWNVSDTEPGRKWRVIWGRMHDVSFFVVNGDIFYSFIVICHSFIASFESDHHKVPTLLSNKSNNSSESLFGAENDSLRSLLLINFYLWFSQDPFAKFDFIRVELLDKEQVFENIRYFNQFPLINERGIQCNQITQGAKTLGALQVHQAGEWSSHTLGQGNNSSTYVCTTHTTLRE